jgi:hypothetical protein
LSAQGFLFGTPTEAGVFNIVVRATDSLGEHGDGVFALTVTPGVSLRTADSSFVLGGAIPAGDASVTPDDGSDPISGVSMSAGGALSVPVSGAANGGGFGLQLSGDGLACNSSLEVTDAAGTLFNVVAVPTTGCASDTVNGTPDVEPLAQAQAPASAFAGAHSAAVAHSAGQLLSSGTISFTSGSPAQTLSLGTSTISTTGIFNATFPPTSTGPVRVQVTGGEYTSELSGTVQTTGFTLSTLVGSTAQLPPIIPVTPLTTLIDNYNPSTPILNPPVVTAKSPYPTNIFTDYGFPTGTIAQQVVPIFTTTVTTNPIAILPILEGGIGTLGVSNRGDLISALQQDIADGVFDGQPNGQPLPLGSATLPINATNTLFATGLSPGDIIPVTTLPVLPPIVSAPIEVIPVSPIPLPTGQAAITRIGPAAFTETLTANAPSGAQAPFSTTSDTFTLEVVAAN